MRDRAGSSLRSGRERRVQQDRDGAVIPKQPEEIAEAAYACWKAGAAVLHVHARNPQGKNSGDPAIYSAIVNELFAPAARSWSRPPTASACAAIRRRAGSCGPRTTNG